MTVEVSRVSESSELPAHWNLYRYGNLVAVLGDRPWNYALETAAVLVGVESNRLRLHGYSIGYNWGQR
jgi:hypothetical protein